MTIPLFRRAPNLLWLLVGLIAGALIMSGDFAAGRHQPPDRGNSTAAFKPGFAPPPITCKWVNSLDGERIHDYVCRFPLDDLLERGGNPPSGQGWDGLAAPDEFFCKPDGSPNLDASHYQCSYRHKVQGNRHTHTFTADQIVSVTFPGTDPNRDDLNDWVLPHLP
jgi:hypothetical protein